jgi:hypothetical protein
LVDIQLEYRKEKRKNIGKKREKKERDRMMLSDSGYVLCELDIVNFLYVVEKINMYSVSPCTFQCFSFKEMNFCVKRKLV